MVKVNRRKDESIDKVLRKFKGLMKREGILSDLREREFYEKPSQRKRKQLDNAIRKERQRRSKED